MPPRLAIAPVALAAVLLSAGSPAAGQDAGVLAGRAEKLRQGYVREAVDLAAEYERAGDPAGAIRLLEQARALAPDSGDLDRRIDALRETALSAGETTLQLDAPTAWTPVARVGAGRRFRVRAEGELRVRVEAALTPAGLPPGSGRAGLVTEHPFGALLGTYLDPKKAAEDARRAARRPRSQNRSGEEQEVFLIGAGGADERSSEADGILYVRLNVPAGARVTGRVKLTLSGDVAPVGSR